MRGAGGAGAALYVAAYVLACVLLIPGSVLTLAAGFAYGPVQGTLLVMVASMLGAMAAFVLGRTVLRGPIERRLASQPRFAAVDRAVGAQGFKVVLLLRLSPLFPFNLLNYALGLTRVRLGTYALASLIGMFPGTLLYVYLGSLVTSAAELASGRRPQGGPYGQLLFWGGLVATVVATVLITRTARRALAQALEAPAAKEAA
ncbi:TVP38/TMEM64 family protein [Aggregicoccus sp. 17bor-14]|nr:TVP38/TMEM64 family protein [Simulacricoccus sp. 17bor-14]MRI89453.1 TVP38/TMEM64 family protein [Aggregicoccus sp. 17bor-14]